MLFQAFFFSLRKACKRMLRMASAWISAKSKVCINWARGSSSSRMIRMTSSIFRKATRYPSSNSSDDQFWTGGGVCGVPTPPDDDRGVTQNRFEIRTAGRCSRSRTFIFRLIRTSRSENLNSAAISFSGSILWLSVLRRSVLAHPIGRRHQARGLLFFDEGRKTLHQFALHNLVWFV